MVQVNKWSPRNALNVHDELTEHFTLVLRQWLKERHKKERMRPLYGALGAKKLASIVVQCVLRRMTWELRINEFRRGIANAIRAETSKLKREPIEWDNRTHLRVGGVMLALFMEGVGVIERVIRPFTGDHIIVPTEDALCVLEEVVKNDRESLRDARPARGPVEPRRQRRNCNVSLLGEHAVWALQETEWRINPNIRDVLQEAFHKEAWVPDVPGGETPPLDAKQGTLERKRQGSAYIRWRRKRSEAASIVAAADLAPDPLFMDWVVDHRGRMYARSKLISPQGSDLPRAMLEFSQGVPIGDKAHHLARHGANQWGLSALDYDAREAWVREHEPWIKECARDPLGASWWHGADAPWRFLAFCMEWESYLRHGPDHITRLPCQIDGTCNAFQVAALLLRSDELANAVSLGHRRTDFYQSLVQRVTEMARHDREFGHGWLRLGGRGVIQRKWVKSCCIGLILSQGITPASTTLLRKLVNSKELAGHEPWGGKLRGPCIRFTRWVKEAMGDAAQRSLELQKWIRQSVKRALKADGPLTWETPTGWTVDFSEPHARITTTSAKIMGREVKFEECGMDLDSRDNGKSSRSSPPSVIHSLDASVAGIVVGSVSYPLSIIHDCFAAHAPNMDHLHATVRHAVVRVFDPNPLQSFSESIGDPNPEPLPQGSFDPKEVLSAPYAYT